MEKLSLIKITWLACCHISVIVSMCFPTLKPEHAEVKNNLIVSSYFPLPSQSQHKELYPKLRYLKKSFLFLPSKKDRNYVLQLQYFQELIWQKMFSKHALLFVCLNV